MNRLWRVSMLNVFLLQVCFSLSLCQRPKLISWGERCLRIRSESIKIRCGCVCPVLLSCGSLGSAQPWEKRFLGGFCEPFGPFQGTQSTEVKKIKKKNLFFFFFFQMKRACAPATGIRQQILRARSSAAFFFFYLPFTHKPSGNKKIRRKRGPWFLNLK